MWGLGDPILDLVDLIWTTGWDQVIEWAMEVLIWDMEVPTWGMVVVIIWDMDLLVWGLDMVQGQAWDIVVHLS